MKSFEKNQQVDDKMYEEQAELATKKKKKKKKEKEEMKEVVGREFRAMERRSIGSLVQLVPYGAF